MDENEITVDLAVVGGKIETIAPHCYPYLGSVKELVLT